MYYQINRPDTKSFYTSTLEAYGDTVSGSDEAWTDYLKVCKLSLLLLLCINMPSTALTQTKCKGYVACCLLRLH